MKKIIILSMIVMLCLPMVFASEVSRSLSDVELNPGDLLNVTLNVTLNQSELQYIIDDYFPSNWTVIDNGGLIDSVPGKLSALCIDGMGCTVENTSFTYTLQAPSILGQHEFNGTYYFEVGKELNITGEKFVNVTNSIDTTPPVISNVVNDSITNESAAISWDTDEAADSLLEYGTDLSLGMNVTDNSLITSHMISLGNLTSNTTYYYNITSCDNDSNCAIVGPYSFTTLENSLIDVDAPLISNVRAESVGSNSATILWDSDENANSTVYYGNSTSLGERAGSSSMVIGHSVGLSGLDPNITYYYKVESCDSSYNCANSSVYNFTTLIGTSDDLEVNYIKGQIIFETGNASAGTLFWINVTSGTNAGYVYSGSVDDNKIPSFLQGEGRYDTGDIVEFNTGDSFILSADNCVSVVSDIFVEGGNSADLICSNQAPIIDVPDMNVSEDTNPGLIDLWNYTADDRDDDENLTFELISQSNAGLINCSLVSNRYINCSDPADDLVGVSTLIVNVTDLSNLTNTDSFDINILAVNDAPVIGVMDQNIDEDSSILVDLDAYSSDADGDNLSYYITQHDINEVSCVVNGNILNISGASNWWGNATCSVIASDGLLNSTEETFNIFVTNIDDAPQFNSSNPVPNQTWDEDNVNVLDLSPYVIDIDGIGLSYSVSGNTNISISFVDSVATMTSDADWNGVETVVFNVSNSAGSSTSNDVVLTVNAVNDAPTIDVTDQNMNEDSTISIDLSLFASDIEGDALNYYVTQQNDINCVLNGNILNITSDNNWWGNASCGVIASDGLLNSTEDVFDIIVNNTDDAPLFNSSNPVPNQTWDEDNVNVLDLSPYVIDIDGIGLSYSVSGNTNISINFVGSVATMTPDDDWNGVETVVFNVSNSAGSSTSNDVVLTVNAVNDAPVISNVSGVIVTENQTVIVRPIVTDVEGDNVTVSYSSPLDSNGEWKTDFDDAGVYNAVVSADDGNGGISNVNFMIIVNEAGNHDPILTILNPVINVTEGEVVQVLVNATDLDNDVLTYSYESPLDSTGEWQTGFTDAGVYNLSVRVDDGNNGSDTEYVLINVSEAGNQAPVLDPISDISVYEGEIAEIVPSATDPDNDSLTFIFTNPLNSSGEWQTNYTDAGSYQTLVTVTDGSLNDSQYVTINVLEVGNHDPVLDYVPDENVTEGEIVQLNPSGSDPDGDDLYFTFSSPINSTGGWETDFTDAGVYTITVTANDGNGGTDSQDVTITVNEFGNHNPVLDLVDNVTVTEGEVVQIVATASDVDWDGLMFIFENPLDSNGRWQTGYTDAGLYTTVVRVEDGNGGADSQTIYIDVIESGNHAPVISNIGDITAIICDTVVINPIVSDPDNDLVSVTISAPVENDGVWNTCDYESGEYKVIVSASDGDLETNQEIIITLLKKPRPHTNIDSLKILNDYIEAGEDLEISLKLGNDGMKDLKGARITAIVQELGIRAKSRQFNIKAGDVVNKRLILNIPYDVPAGRYELRVTISNDESRRVKYREFIVI